MTAATRLVFVRHGRTTSNAAGLLVGRADPPLDALGEAQAAALGAMLGPVDQVVCSPLGRTRATAAAIDGPLTIDERFIELDYGDWDGLPIGEVRPAAWQQWRADVGFAPPGGESLAALGLRVREACVDWAGRAEAEGWSTVVVVSHVSPVKAAVAWALGAGDDLTWRLFLDNASISTIALRGGAPVLCSFNETGHLAHLR